MTDPILMQEIIGELEEEGINMDVDKEMVQVVAIIGGVTVAIAAMLLDGSVGDAIGTVILTGGTAAVAYLAGKARGNDEKEA
jgi:hypothetical protein